MILSYLSHKKIRFSGIGLKVIATKNIVVYQDLIAGFQENNKLLSCYDDNYQKQELNKIFELEGDLLLTQNLSSKFLNTIIKTYIKNLDPTSRDNILQSFHNLEDLLQDSLLLEDLPLEINFVEDLSKLTKLVGVHLDNQLMKNPYDILKMIVKVHQRANLKTIPVVCNAAHYLNQEEFNELFVLLKQLKQTLILIEFTDQNFQAVVRDAEFYYIDEDLVDWY